VAAAAAILVPASPAFAASKSCSIPSNSKACASQAPHLPANSVEHAILLTAYPPSNLFQSVTCRAHDAVTGSEVGRTTASNWTTSEKVIPGLWGTYFVYCTSTQTGSGSGRISN
jgi:hypothetical protein